MKHLKAKVLGVIPCIEASGNQAYLGLPTEFGRSKKETFSQLQARVNQRLSGWKGKLLSHAGKETLIKSVISALPTYSMSCFKLSATLSRDIERAATEFYWSNSSSSKTIHWMSWDRMAKPKADGGLGFKKLEAQNLALLSKLGWTLLDKPSNLWSRTIKGLYYPSSHFLSATVGSRPSWAWRSIIASRSLISKGIAWSIGDGFSVNIWLDRWVPGLPDYRISSSPPSNGPELVSSLIDQSDRVWKLDTLISLFQPHEIECILKIPIPMRSRPDKIIWTPNKFGKFTVKSAYQLHMASNYSSQASSSSSLSVRGFWNRLWHIQCPPKINSFLWRSCHNAIACRANLFQRHCSFDPHCGSCPDNLESTFHVLLDCPIAQAIWFASPLSLRPSSTNSHTVLDWLHWWFTFSKKMPNREELDALVAQLMWEIWIARNNRTFNGKSTDPLEVIHNAMAQRNEFMDARSLMTLSAHSSPSLHQPIDRWRPPRRGALKLNSDAAFSQHSHLSASASIIRDSLGSFMMATCSPEAYDDILILEALAIKKGLIMALEHGFLNMEVESDNSTIIRGLNDSETPTSVISIVEDIVLLSENFSFISFKHIPRKANEAADKIAKHGLGLSVPSFFCYCPPWLHDVIVADANE